MSIFTSFGCLIISLLPLLISFFISSCYFEYKRDKANGYIYFTHFSKGTAIIVRIDKSKRFEFENFAGYEMSEVGYVSYKLSHFKKIFVKFM